MKWNKKFQYPESIKSLKKTFESNIPSVSLILKETMPEEKKLVNFAARFNMRIMNTLKNLMVGNGHGKGPM